jgi:c-di-GMP-binding flagellar brake protein YcgR
MGRKRYRKYPRVEADIPVELESDAGTERTRASMLGGGGLFLGVAQEIPPGTEITVRFRPAKHLPVISARTIVRYVVPEKGVGIEFTEIDPQHREMILRLIHHRMVERRQYPRAPLATQVEHAEGTQIGFSKDISVGGMFIELTKPVPVGSRLNLLFHLDDEADAVRAEAEVLYSVLKLGVGVRFLALNPADQSRIEAYVAQAKA